MLSYAFVMNHAVGAFSCLAMLLSWHKNKSALWAFIAFYCSFFYVFYYLAFASGKKDSSPEGPPPPPPMF